MSKKALVILAEGFEEIEAVTVINILRRGGVEVMVAGLSDVKVQGSRGIVVEADQRLEAESLGFDAIVLPGGSLGAKNLAASQRIRRTLLSMNEDKKIIGAICASPAVVLAPLGILDGKKATCFPGMEKEYFSKKTSYDKDPVVRDGTIITSRSAGTAVVFALALLEELEGKEIKNKVIHSIALN